MSNETNIESYIQKFEGLAKEFEVDLNAMSENTERHLANIKEEVQTLEETDIEDYKEAIRDIVTINDLESDFNTIRTTLLENIRNGREILQRFTNEILLEGAEVNPNFLKSYSSLIDSLTSSIKTLSETYSKISNTIRSIQKIIDDNKKEKEEEQTLIQNNYYISSTADLLREIKEKSNKVIDA